MEIALDRLVDEGEALSAASGEPVDASERTLASLWVSTGRIPDFFTASMYFAEVPNSVIRSASGRTPARAERRAIE